MENGSVAPRVVRTREELAAARSALTGTVAVVMTMGALHSGHESLLRAARAGAAHVIATIFVNPLQFGPNEDFDRYPRTFEADLEVCRRAGVDLVFAPAREEVYPGGEPAVRVNPGPLGERFEGASRPGFFHGVLTVVLKLLHLVRPDRAYFGEKDYQQLTLIRRMVRDLDVPVEIVGVPTVREPDGLALSSRNRYLSDSERRAALGLSAALRAGAAAAEAGRGPDEVLAEARAAFPENAPGVRLDYLVLADPDLGPEPEPGSDLGPGSGPVTDPAPFRGPGPARLLVAAWVGNTRLIDNAAVRLA
ncbi:pantoate--beta-alanine ligase [Micromonospora sp. NPDC049559]|uniref:pantoate--beta-alanine ligase n=1 Tax=Micromonospora sp. NPDC049559 TaxID=3155923 RepID=UPI0034291323